MKYENRILPTYQRQGNDRLVLCAGYGETGGMADLGLCFWSPWGIVRVLASIEIAGHPLRRERTVPKEEFHGSNWWYLVRRRMVRRSHDLDVALRL